MRHTMSRTRIRTEKCPWMARKPNEQSDKTWSDTQSNQSLFPLSCRWLSWFIWSGIAVICVKVKDWLICDAIVPMHFIHTVAPAILMNIMTTVNFSTVHFQNFNLRQCPDSEVLKCGSCTRVSMSVPFLLIGEKRNKYSEQMLLYMFYSLKLNR